MKLHYILVIVVALIPNAVGADNIITGCDKGAVEHHKQTFPKQAIGEVPDKILNWEIALAEGKYEVLINSFYEFEPLIYKKVNEEYKFAGLPRSAKAGIDPTSGKRYYGMVFTANHAQSVDQNFWLLQMKPKPVHQNTTHDIQVTIVHKECPKTKSSACNCPSGYKVSKGALGQSECVNIAKPWMITHCK